MAITMSESSTQIDALKPLLERMVAARQLSQGDVHHLVAHAERSGVAGPSLQTEEDVLRWLAREYGLTFTTLEDVEPDRELLSLFPARILLKEELLPLKRTQCVVEI